MGQGIEINLHSESNKELTLKAMVRSAGIGGKIGIIAYNNMLSTSLPANLSERLDLNSVRYDDKIGAKEFDVLNTNEIKKFSGIRFQPYLVS